MFDNCRFVGAALACVVVMVAGCVTTPVPPLTDADHRFGQTKDEISLIRRSSELDDDLRRKGLLLQDEQVSAYVNGVGRRVVPAVAQASVPFQFHVLRDPAVNAFALPNGSIYLTVGILARLENEAQLAHVMSHEAAHVVQRHGVLGLRNRKATVIAAHIADLALFGTSIAYLPALGSLAMHSREHEREADRLALEYMAQAGYTLADADQLFAILSEVGRSESVWGSVYSSHPDNHLRAEAARTVSANARMMAEVGGRVGVPEYREIRRRVFVEDLQLKLDVRRYELAATAADRALAEAPESPWLHYYRGEAYRLMAEDSVGAAREHALVHGKKYTAELVEHYRQKRAVLLATARQEYQRALLVDRGFATAYRGLGLVEYAEGDGGAARLALRQYLSLGREITDRRYITDILGRLDRP